MDGRVRLGKQPNKENLFLLLIIHLVAVLRSSPFGLDPVRSELYALLLCVMVASLSSDEAPVCPHQCVVFSVECFEGNSSTYEGEGIVVKLGPNPSC